MQVNKINTDILELASKMNCQELHFVSDNLTGLKGVVAIHNTKLGPALGGCRFIEYDSTYDAVKDAIRLAEGMTFKSAASGLPLGGGKAVLIKPKSLFNEADEKAYFEAFGEFVNNLAGRYITAVDSGTSTRHMDFVANKTKYVCNTSFVKFTSQSPAPKTTLGVLRGIESSVNFRLNKKDLAGVHVAIQGLGAVGYRLAKMLHEKGAKLSVFDVNKALMDKCVSEFKAFPLSSNDEFFSVDCDVLAPCALGAIVNHLTIPKIKAKIIAGAANNQLNDPINDAKKLKEKGILYAPDFVINSGGLIYVAMEKIGGTEDVAINQINDLYGVLNEIYVRSENSSKTTFEVAKEIALERIKNKSKEEALIVE